MAEIYVPHNFRDRNVPQLIENVEADLPLEDCERQLNPLNGHIEFTAPQGMAFRISGKFMLNTDQSDICIWGPPQYSAAHDERNYDAGGDEVEEPAVEEFIGTRLTLAVDNWYLGARATPTDGWKRHWAGDSRSDGDRPKVEVEVIGDTHAWYETGLTDFIWPKGGDQLGYEQDIFDVPNGILYWQTVKAEADFSDLQIELVAAPNQSPTIQPVEVDDSDKNIWTPTEISITVDQDLAICGIQNPSEAVRADWIMHKRLTGRPYSGDPLKDLKILIGQEFSSARLNLARLVEDTVTKYGTKPASYAESQRLSRERDKERWRKAEMEKEKKTLAIASGSVVLCRLVEANRDGRWLDEAMASYDEHQRRWSFLYGE